MWSFAFAKCPTASASVLQKNSYILPFLASSVLFFALTDMNVCPCSVRHASFFSNPVSEKIKVNRSLVPLKTLPMARKLPQWFKNLVMERAQSFSTRRVFLQCTVSSDFDAMLDLFLVGNMGRLFQQCQERSLSCFE